MKRMKNYYLLLCVSVFTIMQTKAQESVMVVDNQTPGWLSSLMTYSQQVAVEDLTVTGYVNETDMDFLCGLIKNRKLSKLNLYDVNVIPNNGMDNLLWEGFMKTTGDNILSKLILPVNVKGRLSDNIFQCNMDTVVVSSPYTFMPCSKDGTRDWVGGHRQVWSPYKYPKVILIDEGVKHIREYDFMFSNNYKPVVILANSVENIEARGFYYCKLKEPFQLPNNIIRLGTMTNNSTYGVTWLYDYNDQKPLNIPVSITRFDFPDSMKVYYGGEALTNGSSAQTIFHKYTSDTIVVGEKCDTLYVNLNAKIAYFKAENPPVTEPWSCLGSIDLLYVPIGCVDAYKTAYSNSVKIIKEVQNVYSVTISPMKKEMEVNDEIQLKATIQPYDAFDKSLSWTSSDESIASVDVIGKVTAHQPGVAQISAISSDGGIEGICEIIVLQHATGISINPSDVEMNEIGATTLLLANVVPENSCDKSVEWLSSNIAVCHVSNNGLLTATGYGTTVVFATTVDGGFTASCVVTVKEPSGVSEVENEISEYTRFSLSGLELESPTKGLNLIKYKDGTIKKIIHK